MVKTPTQVFASYGLNRRMRLAKTARCCLSTATAKRGKR
jgi:hypothetical protein